jgi:hypothetical protein
MPCRNALPVALSLLLTGFAACTYNPSIHPDKLKCRDNNGCPSGYRCVGVAGNKPGFCCNKPDAAACFPPTDAASAPTDATPTDAPADGTARADGSVDAIADGRVAGDGAADKPTDGLVLAPDSGADVADGGQDVGTGGTRGSGDAGVPEAPGGRPDLPVGGTEGGATGGSGGSGDARVPAAPDGQFDVPFGGSGGTDSSTPNALDSAGADAPGAGDAGTAGPQLVCGPASASVFRDSFDQSVLVTGSGWSSSSTGGGSFALDTVQFASPPASALASLPATSDMTMTSTTLRISSMDAHLPTAYLSFDVRISSKCVARMRLGYSSFIAGVSPSMQYNLYISIESNTPNTLCVSEFKDMGTTFPAAGRQIINLDEWQHVELQIRFSGEPRGFLQVGAGPAQYFTPHPSGSATVGDEPLSFFIGPYMTGPSDGCDINYDNVVFDAPAPCP